MLIDQSYDYRDPTTKEMRHIDNITVVYGWDTTDPRNPGWYAEVRDYTGDTIDDSMKGGFPVDVDAYSEDDGTGASYLALALALRGAYPDARIIQGDGVRGFGAALNSQEDDTE